MSFNILLVDDNNISQQALAELFRSQGWRCTLAANGMQGLACAERQSFDAVISGFFMPLLDGPHFIPLLRQLEGYGSLPIVVLSTHTREEVAASMDMSQVNGFWRKPLNCDTKQQLLDHLSTEIVAWRIKAA
ncbi:MULTISPECIES: response regulator [Shewanella]|jgi:CheY-like chemotaxis protein|uniref:Response regulator n=1 Tax=Shewanella indica TaxID=768528 RepID=A0ABU4QIT4_9GAMM|nr:MULTISPECIES: response regulator [Shewanella]OIN14209.1 hypothetical protein BFS86_12130 [Shewanella algae]BCV37176.1 hypothetical protein TUM17377_25040 [Shewanella chilikensis]MCE9793010.1 response regulator [Shewanella indica]MDX6018425.1 response regulator [Shewanella indica]NDO74369.1 response regulator [Shewanella sp. SE1]